MKSVVINSKEYPLRTVVMNDMSYIVGTEALGDVINDLLDSDDEIDEKFASQIDDRIYFYVPNDKIELPDDDLVKYLEVAVI
ncbi:hypothetical protein [Acinetobacter sp. P1(2025)]|uniref:hypothetical protein n=1 Tax=Acinetobacter sp. P1(2025) TaxID=3446120 RepID=UPI003F534F6A